MIISISIIAVASILINIALVGLNLKLYTEYFKAENQRKKRE
jgi:hypothetical protein